MYRDSIVADGPAHDQVMFPGASAVCTNIGIWIFDIVDNAPLIMQSRQNEDNSFQHVNSTTIIHRMDVVKIT